MSKLTIPLLDISRDSQRVPSFEFAVDLVWKLAYFLIPYTVLSFSLGEYARGISGSILTISIIFTKTQSGKVRRISLDFVSFSLTLILILLATFAQVPASFYLGLLLPFYVIYFSHSRKVSKMYFSCTLMMIAVSYYFNRYYLEQDRLISFNPFLSLIGWSIIALITFYVIDKQHNLAEDRFKTLDIGLTKSNEIHSNLKHTIELLELEKNRYQTIFNSFPDAIIEFDYSELFQEFSKLESSVDLQNLLEKSPKIVSEFISKAKVTRYNPNVLNLYGIDHIEELNTRINHIFDPCTPRKIAEGVFQIITTGTPYETQVTIQDARGNVKHLLNKLILIPNTQLTLLMNIDITDINTRKIQLERSLQEKDTLLREIHHRVKNNMQLMISLLELQANNKNESQNEFIQKSESRIRSMSMVHEVLYSTSDFSKISASEYCRKLVDSFENLYAEQDSDIVITEDIDGIEFDLDDAIPLGLILNELLTNAYKHAFPQGKGEITLSIKQNGEGPVISVSDNGIGMDATHRKDIGFQIIEVLVQQLDAKLTVESDPGTKITIQLHN